VSFGPGGRFVMAELDPAIPAGIMAPQDTGENPSRHGDTTLPQSNHNRCKRHRGLSAAAPTGSADQPSRELVMPNRAAMLSREASQAKGDCRDRSPIKAAMPVASWR
jgi:hypothetical protein